MRRTIRSRRHRIERIKQYLEKVGFLTRQELDQNPVAWPWLLAAMVLTKQRTLNALELWSVLRWYAHNRGYDGNSKWAKNCDDEKNRDDSKRESIAKERMKKYGTATMAETICAYLGVSVDGKKKSSKKRFKEQLGTFPRKDVEDEVRQIIKAHQGVIPSVNSEFVQMLIENAKAIDMEELKLPKRFDGKGGLLFGQLIPRFDNRIIGECPFTGQKLPSKKTIEFLKYRWAMLVANILVQASSGKSRILTGDERQKLLQRFEVAGKLTISELKKALFEITNNSSTNLDSMFVHPDAKKALIYNLSAEAMGDYWSMMSSKFRSRVSIQLMRGKKFSYTKFLEQARKIGESTESLEVIHQKELDKKKNKNDQFHEKIFKVDNIEGRAPYSRPILLKAFEEVLAGKDPRSEGGCLYRSQEILEKEKLKPLDQQTNNPLIRHRLLILQRLLKDLISEFASGESSSVKSCVIEVARDLPTMSGKTNEKIKGELDSKLKSHKEAIQWLQKDDSIRSGKIRLSAGLIRKARIVLDQNFTCPYTGYSPIEPADLIHGKMDLDHIIPQSQRPSDSLSSLVITFKAVNAMKNNRTALQFIEEEQGKSVGGMSHISIRTLNGSDGFLKFVDELDTKGHQDDTKRKRLRKSLLLKIDYTEKEFLPKDLTQTSHLVRMGVQTLERYFKNLSEKPAIVSIPGAVTAAIRKTWNLLGTLSKACPEILNENGNTKIKSEIRKITHLHHALDAIVLGITAQAFPKNGRVWELVVKRSIREEEKKELKEVSYVLTNHKNKIQITDLPESMKNQIRERLAEKRVVQHIPKERTGLPAKLNTWGIGRTKEGKIELVQYKKGINEQGEPIRTLKLEKGKLPSEKPQRLIGFLPSSDDSKLKKIKGVRVISENYGIALDPVPQIIPYFQVWKKIGEIKKRNNGIMPRILRNGMLIKIVKGKNLGIWKILSVMDVDRDGLTIKLSKVDQSEKSAQISVSALIKCGLVILDHTYCGISALSES